MTRQPDPGCLGSWEQLRQGAQALAAHTVPALAGSPHFYQLAHESSRTPITVSGSFLQVTG